MKKSRVLVVDDHPFFRVGIARWIDQQDDLVCCGEAGSGAAAREMIATTQPDIVLLDIRLEDADGIELTRDLTATQPDLRIIVISQYGEDTHAHRALRAGARGYLMKSEATETVSAAIAAVLAGDIFLGRKATARILQNLFPDPASPHKDLSHLSDRELEVFQMIGSGTAPREIAKTLGISPKTVDSYREHIKNKLNLNNGNALTRAATVWVETGRWQT